jgi:hypothetical protein
VPEHDHVHGPVPATAEEFPTLHKFVVGALDTATPLAVPQFPLAAAAARVAYRDQWVVPPLVEVEYVAGIGP